MRRRRRWWRRRGMSPFGRPSVWCCRALRLGTASLIVAVASRMRRFRFRAPARTVARTGRRRDEAADRRLGESGRVQSNGSRQHPGTPPSACPAAPARRATTPHPCLSPLDQAPPRAMTRGATTRRARREQPSPGRPNSLMTGKRPAQLPIPTQARIAATAKIVRTARRDAPPAAGSLRAHVGTLSWNARAGTT